VRASEYGLLFLFHPPSLPTYPLSFLSPSLGCCPRSTPGECFITGFSLTTPGRGHPSSSITHTHSLSLLSLSLSLSHTHTQTSDWQNTNSSDWSPATRCARVHRILKRLKWGWDKSRERREKVKRVEREGERREREGLRDCMSACARDQHRSSARSGGRQAGRQVGRQARRERSNH